MHPDFSRFFEILQKWPENVQYAIYYVTKVTMSCFYLYPEATIIQKKLLGSFPRARNSRVFRILKLYTKTPALLKLEVTFKLNRKLVISTVVTSLETALLLLL